MIDNYDSFVFNLKHYLIMLGRPVHVVRNDAISIDDIERLKPYAICISPGPKSPLESGISLDIINKFANQTPILGICLGHQCIAQVWGAKIRKAKKPFHGKTSSIIHNEKYLFEGLPVPLQVMRYHSLEIDKASLPSELSVEAWTEENQEFEPTIMAIRHQTFPLFGLQFHPESISTQDGLKLLNNFLNEARFFYQKNET